VTSVVNSDRRRHTSTSNCGPSPTIWRSHSNGYGEVDDDGDVLVAAAGVARHVLFDPDHGHSVEAPGSAMSYPLPFV
jgi:hypothetical protein